MAAVALSWTTLDRLASPVARAVGRDRLPSVTGYGRTSGRRSAKFWVAVVLAVILVIFVAQNSQTVTVDFLFTTTETPLVVALVITGVLGALIGWLIPRVRRDD